MISFSLLLKIFEGCRTHCRASRRFLQRRHPHDMIMNVNRSLCCDGPKKTMQEVPLKRLTQFATETADGPRPALLCRTSRPGTCRTSMALHALFVERLVIVIRCRCCPPSPSAVVRRRLPSWLEVVGGPGVVVFGKSKLFFSQTILALALRRTKVKTGTVQGHFFGACWGLSCS